MTKYTQCHKAIRDNATNQDCKKFLKLIDLLEANNLTIIYGYNRTMHSLVDFTQQNIKHIEIIDEVILKKLGLKVSIIKNVDTTVLLETNQNFYKLTKTDIKLFTKRMILIDKIVKVLTKFDLNNLPKL